MAEMIYYKKNRKYVVGGRYFIGDAQGWTLTDASPYVSIASDKHRDFKLANKENIIEGKIVLAEEPSIDWETNNAITDEQAAELVKNYMQLKQALEKIDSYSAALNLLEVAKQTDRPNKTLRLIEARVSELADNDDEFSRPEDMKGEE